MSNTVYGPYGEIVVQDAGRVTDVALAHDIAQELHDHKEATEYWVAQADQARLKAADLNDQLLSLGEQTDDGKIADETVAHGLALEVNEWRDRATNADRWRRDEANAHIRTSAKLTEFQDQVRDELIELESCGDVDREKLNEILETLGLAKHIQKFKVTVLVTVLVDDPDSGDADSAAYNAQHWVDNQLSSSYDGSYTLDDVEYKDADEINE